MPLLSKALLEANIRKIAAELAGLSRPGGMTKTEWKGVQNSIDRGNRNLFDILGRGDESSNWEWGGVAKPEGETIPQTSMSPVQFALSPAHTTFNPNGHNVVYHSHPSRLSKMLNGDQVTAGSLSGTDLGATWGNKNTLRGVTAVDPDAGFGYMIMHQNAPSAPSGPEWQQLKNIAQRAAEPFTTRDLYKIQPVEGSYSVGHLPSIHESSLAMERGLGQAMHRTGILEHYGMMPGTPAAAAGEAKLAPAVTAATDAAEEYLSNWLRSKGYSDGKVRAIIGSLIASGSLAAVASNVANREAVDA